MKSILKIATALLCLQLLVITAFAQVNKKTFVGIWELSQESDNGQPFQNTPHGFLKIFNADGTFANVQARNTGSIISHDGKYKVKDKEYYTEKVLHRIPEMGGGLLGKDFKINYTFSEDEKLLTINFTATSGVTVTEVWRRL